MIHDRGVFLLQSQSDEGSVGVILLTALLLEVIEVVWNSYSIALSWSSLSWTPWCVYCRRYQQTWSQRRNLVDLQAIRPCRRARLWRWRELPSICPRSALKELQYYSMISVLRLVSFWRLLETSHTIMTGSTTQMEIGINNCEFYPLDETPTKKVGKIFTNITIE